MKINIIGTGFGAQDITIRSFQVLLCGGKTIAKSSTTCGIDILKQCNIKIETCDDIIQKLENCDEQNREIAKRLIVAADVLGEINFLIEGNGFDNGVIQYLTNCNLEFFPTLSRTSYLKTKQNISSFTELSATEFSSIRNIGGELAKAIYIFGINSKELAIDVQNGLSKLINFDNEIVLFSNIEKVISLSKLSNLEYYDDNTAIIAIQKDVLDKTVFTFADLLEIIAKLRGEGGCPWDRAQTHQSIRKNVIEEAYEVAEAIDLKSEEKLKEELGDLMLQTVLHAQIAKDEDEFEISDIINILCRKMIDRHTHIFGADKVVGEDEAHNVWDKNKEKLKGQTRPIDSILDVPKTLPALMYAQKISKRAARSNFDFENVNQIFAKLNEEIDELKEAITNNTNISEEVGDLLFAAANIARFLKVDAEEALTYTSQKFIDRFSKMQDYIDLNKVDYKNLSLDEWNNIYLIAKEKLETE